MAFPRRLLHEGEELVVDLRPHWSFFALRAFLLGAAVAALVMLGGAGAPEVLVVVLAVVTLVALARFVVRYLQWATTNFVVTSERLVHRSGVMAKKGIEIPLERVSAVYFRQSVLERVLGCGDLVVDSGGERVRQCFSDIRHPPSVQDEVYRQMEANQRGRWRRTGSARTATTGAGPNGLTLVEQLERLDQLRRRGVLSRAEFEAEKAQLLNRL